MSVKAVWTHLHSLAVEAGVERRSLVMKAQTLKVRWRTHFSGFGHFKCTAI